MFRRTILLFCVFISAAFVNGCNNDCCSVTPEQDYAHIELYPDSLFFMTVQAGPAPAGQDVFLFNSGSACLGWKASPSDAWIECSPDSGFTGSCGNNDTLHVTVNTAALEKGTHRGTVYIQSDDADNNPGTVAVTCSVVSLSDIFVIKDAWWTDEVDADSSGCSESARLTWDADVLDGSMREVSAQVFYRAECTEQWQYYFTTACWTITGDNRDDTYFVTVDNLPVAEYEFSIILYQCGEPDVVAKRDNEDDSDLDKRCFESLINYSIYDAWWADESDVDGDGCRNSGRLAWDADVNEGVTSSVQGHVYCRPVGESGWIYYSSTECYDITGKNRDDAYFLSIEGLEPGRYEFIIDLYECGGHGKASERSYLDDPDLSDQCFDEYTPPATGYRIRDAWWTGSVDADGDGYFESRTLVWDPDVDDGTSGMVVSRILYTVTSAGTWMNYGEVECSAVDGSGLDDTLSIDIDGLARECYHFIIFLYECGNLDDEVAIRHYGHDPDLNTQCFEPEGTVTGSVIRSNSDIPATLTGTVTEGHAPVNPYGGVKEAEPAGTTSPDEREGRGRPAPGIR